MFGIYIGLLLFLIGGSLGYFHTDKCMTDCVWDSNWGWYCWKTYHKWDYCSQQKSSTLKNGDYNLVSTVYKYRMWTGGVCNGRCRHFGENYHWCMTPNMKSWDHCGLSDIVEFGPWRSIKSKISTYINAHRDESGTCKSIVTKPSEANSATEILNAIRQDTGYVLHTSQPKTDDDSITDMDFIYIPGTDERSEIQLTLAVSAKIYPRHIQEKMCVALTDEMKRYYSFLDPKGTDQTEYLISNVFGGSHQFWNIIPVEGLRGYYFNNEQCTHGISLWDFMDHTVLTLLKKKTDIYVEYNVIVNHGGLPLNTRPTQFIVQINVKNSNGTAHFCKEGLFGGKDSIEVFINNDNKH